MFFDTSFLIALALKDDPLHGRAVAWERTLQGVCTTSEFVLLELCDALAPPALRPKAHEIVDKLRQDPFIKIFSADSNLLMRGYDLFSSRPDKSWSLTDCTSFVLMNALHIRDDLTHDHHFEQAGFRALLRQDPPQE